MLNSSGVDASCVSMTSSRIMFSISIDVQQLYIAQHSTTACHPDAAGVCCNIFSISGTDFDFST